MYFRISCIPTMFLQVFLLYYGEGGEQDQPALLCCIMQF